MSNTVTQQKPLPKILDVLVLPLFSIVLSFVFAGLTIFALGENPFEAFGFMIMGVFGYSEGIGYTLYYATNFMFTGLAVAIAFNAMAFNIGGEGQAYIAGLGASFAILGLDSILPGPLVVIIAILASMAFGAFWAFIPGYLRATRGSHEVITTIMLNFIASALILFIVVDFMVLPGMTSTESRVFAQGTWLPYIHDVAGWFGIPMAKSPLNVSFILALLTAFVLWIYIYKTRWGFALRTLGQSDSVAQYAGINPKRTLIIALCISGAVAGMMPINELIGVNHKMMTGFVAGAGFVGIAVSLIGRNHPLGVVLASLLFGFLYQGGAEMTFENPNISKEMAVAIQGLIILFAGALPLMFKPLFVWLWNAYTHQN